MDMDYEKVWSGSDNGLLNIQQTYKFLDKPKPCIFWKKIPWNSSTPPYRSLMF